MFYSAGLGDLTMVDKNLKNQESKVMNRWIIVVGAIMIQLALGAIYAWSVHSLLECWWRWNLLENVAYRSNGRIVLIGDHTKVPKDGRNIPGITTLHQESETADMMN